MPLPAVGGVTGMLVVGVGVGVIADTIEFEEDPPPHAARPSVDRAAEPFKTLRRDKGRGAAFVATPQGFVDAPG